MKIVIVLSIKMLLERSECVIILEKYAAQQHSQSYILKDYQLTPALEAIGYLGDYYELTLTFSASQSETCVNQTVRFFIKTVPQQSDEPLKGAIFYKESRLYESLLDELQKFSRVKWHPTCYYTRGDLLVLEQIKDSGYVHIKQTNLCDLRMRELMRALAALHAASFVYEQNNEIKIDAQFADLLQEITVSPDIEWFSTGMRAVIAIIKVHPKYQSEDFKQFIQCKLPKILSRVFAMTSASMKYRNVLCHRDPWAANIFFDHSSTNCDDTRKSAILVDFQTCRYAPPSVDLVFAIYLNVARAERQQREHTFIDWYYQFLSCDLATFDLNVEHSFPKVELLQSYEEFRLFGSLYCALAMTIIRVPKEMITNEYKYVERSSSILNLMSIDVELRKCMLDCAEDVMDSALRLEA